MNKNHFLIRLSAITIGQLPLGATGNSAIDFIDDLKDQIDCGFDNQAQRFARIICLAAWQEKSFNFQTILELIFVNSTNWGLEFTQDVLMYCRWIWHQINSYPIDGVQNGR